MSIAKFLRDKFTKQNIQTQVYLTLLIRGYNKEEQKGILYYNQEFDNGSMVVISKHGTVMVSTKAVKRMVTKDTKGMLLYRIASDIADIYEETLESEDEEEDIVETRR